MQNNLVDQLWTDKGAGFGKLLLNHVFDQDAAKETLSILHGIDVAQVIPRELVAAFWLIPILQVLRGFEFEASPFKYQAFEIKGAVARILGSTTELESHTSDVSSLEQFAEPTAIVRDQWNLERGGFMALLRMHRATDVSLARFLGILEDIALPPGPLPRRLVVHLWWIPLLAWHTAPEYLDIRLGLQQALLPRLGRILSEPFPGTVSAILSGTTLSDIDSADRFGGSSE